VTLTLVIGGTRSGKSLHAERLALATGLPVRYVATADASDPSMAPRIAAHVARRPAGWSTARADDDLVGALGSDGISLIDGLGVWIAGVLFRSQGTAEHIGRQVEGLIEAAARTEVIVVAEEAGQGLLPADAESRAWLDLLGESVQRLSAAAERVEYVVAGRAITLAGHPPAGRPPAALRIPGSTHPKPGHARPPPRRVQRSSARRIPCDALPAMHLRPHLVAVSARTARSWLQEPRTSQPTTMLRSIRFSQHVSMARLESADKLPAHDGQRPWRRTTIDQCQIPVGSRATHPKRGISVP